MTTARLLTTAPLVTSVGDIAIAETTSEHLIRAGVPVSQSLSALCDSETAIVGGGHILSPQIGAYGGLFDRFRLAGPHVLSAVGVRTHDRDHQPWDHLADYRYLSVRDVESADAIGLPDISVVPCPATLVNALPLDEIGRIPRMGWVGSLPRGDYVVVHAVESISDHPGLPADAVAVEPQLHVDRPPVRRWRQVPISHSPQVLAGVVAGAKTVVTRSLHLAIFALGSGVPFVAVDQGEDPQSEKLRRYFNRAGLPEAVANPADPVAYALELQAQIADVTRQERRKAGEHLDRIVNLFR